LRNSDSWRWSAKKRDARRWNRERYDASLCVALCCTLNETYKILSTLFSRHEAPTCDIHLHPCLKVKGSGFVAASSKEITEGFFKNQIRCESSYTCVCVWLCLGEVCSERVGTPAAAGVGETATGPADGRDTERAQSGGQAAT